MQLAKVASTRSKRGPSLTRTGNPQSRDSKIPGSFQDALPRDRNAFWLGTVALSRRTDAPKDNNGTPTGHVDALKRDADALSRDLDAQEVNADGEKVKADTQKGSEDAEKDNADAKKINADAEKFNVFARPESLNDLIFSSLRRSRIQNPVTSI